jgi:hypothetical protein
VVRLRLVYSRPHTSENVTDALRRAFERFLQLYAQFGQHRFHGSADWKDPRTYRGPMLWTEDDCVFRLALELEKEYPRWVHMGFQFSKFAAYPWDPEQGDKKGEIDLVVSDVTGFEPDSTSHHRFGSRRHELFLEAKHLPKGQWSRDVKKKVEIDIPKDFAAQLVRLKTGRCLVAASLVVDEEDHVFRAIEQGRLTPPPELVFLLASPSELKRRGIEV